MAGGATRLDGVWADHWYGAVHQSNGFAGARVMLPELEPEMRELMEALPSYDKIAALKI